MPRARTPSAAASADAPDAADVDMESAETKTTTTSRSKKRSVRAGKRKRQQAADNANSSDTQPADAVSSSDAASAIDTATQPAKRRTQSSAQLVSTTTLAAAEAEAPKPVSPVCSEEGKEQEAEAVAVSGQDSTSTTISSSSSSSEEDTRPVDAAEEKSESAPAAASTPAMDSESEAELSSLSIKQLKGRLRELGLPVSGVKAKLVQRLTQRNAGRKTQLSEQVQGEKLKAEAAVEPADDVVMSTEAEAGDAAKGDSAAAVKEGDVSSNSSGSKEEVAGQADAVGEEQEEAEQEDAHTKRGKKKKKKKGKAGAGKPSWSVDAVDISTLPHSIEGVSFMLMGNVNRSQCEGLIYQYGGSVSATVLKKKQQFVITGPAKKNRLFGSVSGEGSKVWAEAKAAQKQFITEAEFEQWMDRLQAAQDEADEIQHSVDQELVQLLHDATPLPDVLIDIVAEYAIDEAPIIPLFHQWCKLEQQASDRTHTSTLPPPATDAQIVEVESAFNTRLPYALKQLLRLHDGAALQGDSAGMRIFPSTAELLAARPHSQLLTTLRWLPWHTSLDATRMPHRTQAVCLVPPHGPLVAFAGGGRVHVISATIELFMQQYLQAWNDNLHSGQERGGERGEWREESGHAARGEQAAAAAAG